ncbi:hypothetical protein BKA70DRAFT_1232251 [Coprinopsis sp. MPI-PUGE-AT-0042]|nr:hypothetical protein BKA70DRAFT_1232251 [Coprinopsis sp. MPI-PUGE-AT-0042]
MALKSALHCSAQWAAALCIQTFMNNDSDVALNLRGSGRRSVVRPAKQSTPPFVNTEGRDSAIQNAESNGDANSLDSEGEPGCLLSQAEVLRERLQSLAAVEDAASQTVMDKLGANSQRQGRNDGEVCWVLNETVPWIQGAAGPSFLRASLMQRWCGGGCYRLKAKADNANQSAITASEKTRRAPIVACDK